jgi:hypothetical protein
LRPFGVLQVYSSMVTGARLPLSDLPKKPGPARDGTLLSYGPDPSHEEGPHFG